MTKTAAQLDREIHAHRHLAKHAGKHSAAASSPRPAAAASKTSDSLHYRDVGSRGAWPAWVRALTDASGVYVIRDKASGRVLYVGSSSHALYATLTRHGQTWTRQKTFWRASYAQNGKRHDPGTTYDRARIEVAVIPTGPAPASLHAERRMIAKLKPRDNLTQHPDGEDAPF